MVCNSCLNHLDVKTARAAWLTREEIFVRGPAENCPAKSAAMHFHRLRRDFWMQAEGIEGVTRFEGIETSPTAPIRQLLISVRRKNVLSIKSSRIWQGNQKQLTFGVQKGHNFPHRITKCQVTARLDAV